MIGTAKSNNAINIMPTISSISAISTNNSPLVDFKLPVSCHTLTDIPTLVAVKATAIKRLGEPPPLYWTTR
jgi:hypothetical protein